METIKQKIIAKYGSVNKFVEEVCPDMAISRTHLYKLLNGVDTNPTIETLMELAKLTDTPLEEVTNAYSLRYRDRKSED